MGMALITRAKVWRKVNARRPAGPAFAGVTHARRTIAAKTGTLPGGPSRRT